MIQWKKDNLPTRQEKERRSQEAAGARTVARPCG